MGETLKQLTALDTGSVAFIYEEKQTEISEGSIKLEIVGWKGFASVRSYVPKNDRIHYLRLLGFDTSKYELNKFEARRVTEAQQDVQVEQEIKINNENVNKQKDEVKPENEGKQEIEAKKENEATYEIEVSKDQEREKKNSHLTS